MDYQIGGNEITNLPAFFSRAARNIAIDRLRRHFRTNRIFVESEDNEEVLSQLLNICSQDPTAHETLENKQALDAVMAAVAELPEKCGRSYILNVADDLTYAEIAAEIGVTVSMVEKYVARARRHIRHTVAPMHPINC